MKIGEKIAYLRKENRLSQEALGEILGVSRQAISKWESDISIPEIDNLVAMSNTFHVSVGHLLGIEEEIKTDEGQDLTEKELKIIEEIAGKYIKAILPQEKSKKEKINLGNFAAIGVAILVTATILITSMNTRISNVRHDYNNLQRDIDNINRNVSNQLNGLTNRVEEILKAQNDIVATSSLEMSEIDIAGNTVKYKANIVPKKYEQGMEVIFSVKTGEDVLEFKAIEKAGQNFEADIACKISNSITIIAGLKNKGVLETQILDVITDLEEQTNILAYANSVDVSLTMNAQGGKLKLGDNPMFIYTDMSDTKLPGGQLKVAKVRAAIYVNDKIVEWAIATQKQENGAKPSSPTPKAVASGDYILGQYIAYFNIKEISMKASDTFRFSIEVTDNFGRIQEKVIDEYVINSQGELDRVAPADHMISK